MADDWKDPTDHNVFQMAEAHGGPGFWVRGTTWDETIARVVRLGAFTAPGPYFGNPSVLIDVYSLGGKLKEEAAHLSTPGTWKTWRFVDAPEWAETIKLRPLDDPALDEKLQKLNKRRNKHNPPAERLWLTVEYAQKDDAKKLGARWAPAERKWWLPANTAAELVAEAKEKGFLVE